MILCGNKIDKRDGEVTAADLQLEVLPIMSEFKVRLSLFLPFLALFFARLFAGTFELTLLIVFTIILSLAQTGGRSLR